jgi:riboflavin transporter FmnP
VSLVQPDGNYFIQGETNMPLATIIRIVAGVLFIVVLGVLVARRKAKNA